MNAKLLKEIQKRTEFKKFSLEEYCFDKQLQFIQDPAKFKAAVCSRRAGKTVACAADLINTVMSHEEGDVAYITLNRRTAKKIIWRQLLEINRKFNLGGKVDNTELTIAMPHGPVIHVSGAKDEGEIQKFLGHPLRKCYIDEAQSFRPYIEDLVESVLEPTLIDFDGSLTLIGTPGPIPAGYFYDATHNDEGWKNFSWTMHDNKYIEIKSKKSPEQHIIEVCKRRGVTMDHPSIQREFFGKWVYDADGLVYKFNPTINIYSQLPQEPFEYIFGVDLGHDDSDAIAVLAYSTVTKRCFLVEEKVQDRQDITSLANQIKDLQAKYKPIKIVVDTGALGKKIALEIQQRHGINLIPADKHRKFEFIELMNDDLRTGKLQAFTGSLFEQDCYLETWDKSKPGRLKISENYHSDINPAVLYSWRECRHTFSEPPPPPKPHQDSAAWAAAYETRLMEDAQNAAEGHMENVDQSEFEDLYKNR